MPTRAYTGLPGPSIHARPTRAYTAIQTYHCPQCIPGLPGPTVNYMPKQAYQGLQDIPGLHRPTRAYKAFQAYPGLPGLPGPARPARAYQPHLNSLSTHYGSSFFLVSLVTPTHSNICPRKFITIFIYFFLAKTTCKITNIASFIRKSTFSWSHRVP